MHSDCYEAWVSIYDEDLESVWSKERKELKKFSIIYFALEKEIKCVQEDLSKEINNIRLQLKQKDYLQKRKRFSGLAQSEQIEFTEDKENLPSPVPFRDVDLNEATNELFIDSPDTSVFVEPTLLSPEIKKTCEIQMSQKSPTMNKCNGSRYYRSRNVSNSPSSMVFYPVKFHKSEKVNKPETLKKESPPKNLDTSDLVDCSIIEGTPDIKPLRKPKNKNLQQWLSKNNNNTQRTKRNSTLTQMVFEPKKKKKEKVEIQSNFASMEIDDMLQVINQSSGDETIASSPEKNLDDDKTLDDLLESTKKNLAYKTEYSDSQDHFRDFVKNYDKVPEKKKTPPKDNVRGKERKKLKGWSCRDCENYYERLNLPPDELEKKKDACSKHRSNVKPRDDTFAGFWDFSLGATPETQEPPRGRRFK